MMLTIRRQGGAAASQAGPSCPSVASLRRALKADGENLADGAVDRGIAADKFGCKLADAPHDKLGNNSAALIEQLERSDLSSAGP
jgi:hypothetical protein